MSQNYQNYTETFFQNLAQKQVELAVNTLFQTNPWLSRSLDQVNSISSQLQGLPSMAGDFLGYEILTHKIWNNRYVGQYCMALYDRQPVNFEFQYYKPRDEWRIQNFNVSYDFPELVTNMIRSSAPQIFD